MDANTPVPPLLALVTGNRKDDWCTLRGFFDQLAGKFPNELASVRLEQPHDHPEYRRLLLTTWCYTGRIRTRLQPGFTTDSTQPQSLILAQAVDALRRVKNCKNVLAYGRGYNLNTMASGSWEVLKSRVGDTVMMYVLLNVSLFGTLENGCYFQLSGEPIVADARATKRAREYDAVEFVGGGSTTGKQGYAGGTRAGKPAGKCLARAEGSGDAKGEAGDAIENTDVNTNSEVKFKTDSNTANKTRKKNSRPPKWRRARHKKRVLLTDACAGGISSSKDPHGAIPGRAPPVAMAKKPSKPKKSYGNHFGDNNNKTNKMQSPADMQVHRHSMFYKQQHAKRCGLPKSHVLMQLDGRDGGSGAALYRCIFKPQLNPVARKFNHLKGMPVAYTPKRFPWRNRHVVALLTMMVRRAHRVQGRMGRLLDLHCPMVKDREVEQKGTDERKQTSGKRKRVDDVDDLDDAANVGYNGDCKEDRDVNMVEQTMLGGTDVYEVPNVSCDNHGVARDGPRERMASTAATATSTATTATASVIPSAAVGQPTPHHRVSAFVWSVLKRVVPREMIGGPRATRVLRRNVTTFVQLKRFESITVHRLMQNLPIGDLPWLHVSKHGSVYTKTTPSTQAKQVKMAAMWVGWLFGGLVVPLLRTHFYCTENESCRQETFYYRKPVWSKMVDTAIKDTLGATFVPVPRNVAMATLQSRKIGVARLRFLPKHGGLRFLMNMSKATVAKFKQRRRHVGGEKGMRGAQTVGDKAAASQTTTRTDTDAKDNVHATKTATTTLKFGPINQRLKLTLSVLQCEARRQPEAFGSSTYGFNDIFCRYKPFVRKWRADRVKALQQGVDPANLEFPHVVCVDVSKAFDNVDVETLLGICSELLTAEKYTILKFTEIMTIMGNVKVNHRSVAVPSHEVQDGHFTQRAAEMANGQKNRIFLDCVTEESITRTHIMNVLRQYLSMNLVWLKSKWRRQSKGIAQGAKPSTLLCSLYLGYVERVCLNPLIASCGSTNIGGITARTDRRRACPDPSHSLLLRMVDDWLLISRHKNVVEQFAAKTIEGIPGFNVVVNPAKTQTTVPIDLPAIGVSVLPNPIVEMDGTRFIRWCGLLIDVETLELRADYTRYSGAHMKTTVNMPVARKPGLALGSKICHYIRPKILAVLLDEEINSRLTVRINIYQMFIIGAMKTHSFLASLPQPPGPGSPCSYIMAAIDVGIKYMIQSTRSKVILRASTNTESTDLNPNLAHAHIEYLALKAFHRTFSIKRSRYEHELLGLLEQRMNSPHMKRVAKHLEEVVSEDHSGVFRSIKF